jgi:holo-[acyl-carrier protein] synthase
MIFGIGIDQIEVDRIEQRLQNQNLKVKIFSSQEIKYCESRGIPAQHYAARFCAKEAFLKALGTGWRGDFEFNQIEILPDENGQPRVHLHGHVKSYFQSLSAVSVHVSLSHLKAVASAVVIIEK